MLTDDTKERLRRLTEQLRPADYQPPVSEGRMRIPASPAAVLSPIVRRRFEPLAPPEPVKPKWPSSVRPGEWDMISEEAQAVMRECFASRCFPLTICGPVGTGKSTFAALIHRDCCVRSAMFLKAATAAAQLKQAEFGGVMVAGCPEPLSELSLMRRWCELAGLLVIDDVTNGHAGGVLLDTAKAMLWKIIDGRADRPLVLTANGTDQELFAWLGQSAADRLRQGTVILMGGDSHRTKGFEERIFA